MHKLARHPATRGPVSTLLPGGFLDDDGLNSTERITAKRDSKKRSKPNRDQSCRLVVVNDGWAEAHPKRAADEVDADDLARIHARLIH